MYYGWPNVFPQSIEVRAVQLPGRESRFKEPRISSAYLLAKQIADALEPFLNQPFALFGYSTGALLAFETARELRRRGASLPAYLFVAAGRAPHSARIYPALAHLPRDELIEKIRYYYQPPEEAWNVPELLDVLLPILRDDIAITDGYKYVDEPPLSCPIGAYVGADDRGTPLDAAQAWRKQTSGEFEISIFPGGHFFLNSNLSDIQDKVRGQMLKLIGEGG